MIFLQQEEVEMEDIAEEEDPVIDIDIIDSNNPLAVVEYVDDLYAHYRKIEVNISILFAYFIVWSLYLSLQPFLIVFGAEFKLCSPKLHDQTSWH